MNKQFAVIGLGRFGSAVAISLADAGYEVTAVDVDEERIQNVEEHVTYVAAADATKKGVCESLGLKNVDVVIIAIASSMEDSILATIMAKDAGAPYVVAKATSDIHATILKKVGADRVVFPERDSGISLAKSISAGLSTQFFSLSDTFSIVETKTPDSWAGKNLIELNPRKKYGINVIGMIEHNISKINIDPQMPLSADWTLVLLGANQDIEKFLIKEGKHKI